MFDPLRQRIEGKVEYLHIRRRLYLDGSVGEYLVHVVGPSREVLVQDGCEIGVDGSRPDPTIDLLQSGLYEGQFVRNGLENRGTLLLQMLARSTMTART